jgi:murein DD-endopeptidase MepM/ murein hydrolase activator NlpD
VTGFTLHAILKDTVNPNDYKSTEKYILPFPRGESTWVVQGNNTGLDHNDSHSGQRFSWDFRLPCGLPVLAAHSGTIDWANSTDKNDGFSQGGTNNKVAVKQAADNTVAFYLHIQQGSMPAKFRSPRSGVPPPTVTVNQGDEIAKVGCVGNTFTGHIHFEVRANDGSDGRTKKSTIGMKFTDDDVKDDGGIPRSFSSYTAGKR